MDLETLKSPSHAGLAEARPGDIAATYDPDVLKSLKLKADFILLPMLAFAYLLKYVRPLLLRCPPDLNYQLITVPYASSLDRSNVSNAYTAGLSADLGLTGNQYNQILTYYQIPFIALGPVVTMLTKMLGARWTIPGMLLGAFESGFLASYV